MTRKAIISREGSLTNVNPMSENERLRAVLDWLLEYARFALEHVVKARRKRRK